MTVYSPTQTARAMFCPMKNALYKEGWRPKYLGIPALAAICGKAIALGLGVYNNYRKQLEEKGRQVDSLSHSEKADIAKYAMDVALRHALDELEDLDKQGFIWNDKADKYSATVQDRIAGTICKYIDHDPLDPEFRIVAVENNLGEEYGNARPDLIYVRLDRRFPGKRILDYKTTSTYRAQYFAADMEKYRDLFQMFHYAWAWEDKYGEKIEEYDICHLVTGNYRCTVKSFPINEEALSLWLQATAPFWGIMKAIEDGTFLPWMVADHEDKWGRCEFYDACFKHRLNEQAMKHRYIKVVKEIA